MRKLHLLALLVLLIDTATSAQITSPDDQQPQQGEQSWVRLSTGTDLNFDRVFMFGPDTAWVTSEQDVALFTTNAGQSWREVRPAGFRPKLFTTPLIGYARGGNRKLIKTTDGGMTWVDTVSTPRDIDYMTNGGQDSLFTLSYGAGGQSMRSLDGGKNWQHLATSVHSPNAMHMASAQYGMIVGDMQLYPEDPMKEIKWGWMDATIYGGAPWVEFRTRIAQNLYSVFALDQYNFFLFTGSETRPFVRTSDGGQTWDSIKVDGFFWRMHFFDKLNGIMAGWSGRIVATTDGGYTWVRQNTTVEVNPSPLLVDIAFYDDSIGMVLGGSVVLRTTNRGKSWVNISPLNQPFSVRAYSNTSTIRFDYSLPQPGEVKLELLDISGRVLAAQLKEFRNRGENSASFDVHTFSSGTYLYRLSALGQSATGKIILTR